MKKKFLSLLIPAAIIVSLLSIPVSAASTDDYSDEYRTSPFYEKLMLALEDSKDKTTMEKTLAAALSQEGYKNYSTSGIDIALEKSNGNIWTGKELRMNDNNTGNTEYTRWAQSVVMGYKDSNLYIDCDWCAIFASWCMYQAGYYTEDQLKKYYYSYCADPRIEFDADSWITAFCMDQQKVWYTPLSERKINAYDWNTYYNTKIDPYDIPYKPGGLIFFSWDGSGIYFDHVAIVIGYDPDEHILTYTNGNSGGQVITKQIDFDITEGFYGQPLMKNSDRIMAYAEYDEIKPLEQKEITADNTDIIWYKDSTSGLKILTNSDSKIASVFIDEEYLGSNIESNMLFNEGRLTIGKSELVGINNGAHTMKLVFDDGVVSVSLKIGDKKPDSPLTNKSYVESGIVPTGSNVKIIGSAEGGIPDYTYEYFYRRSGARVWNTAANGITPKLKTPGSYEIKVIVTDKNGITDEVILNAAVRDPLTNTSTAPGVNAGERAVIYGSATGGAGGYTYTYYYKRNTAKVWKLLGTENTTAEYVSLNAKTAGAFDVKVIVTDSEGTQVEKIMSLGVRTGEELKNNTTISAAEVAPGTRVYINTSAEGGTGVYSWSVRFRKSSATKWTEITPKNGAASFAPGSTETYTVIAELIDADGTYIANEFTVAVAN